MPTSPGDPRDWEDFTWTHEEEPTAAGNTSSSNSSVSSLSDGFSGQREDPYDLLSMAPLIAENLRLRDKLEAVQRASGKISHHEWLLRHPNMPRRPQYGLIRMIVMRVWGWLERATQKVIDTYRWLRG
ncbi:unnamed protein product [Aureobasidium uvarum]|uniref:Uncharacterized protein n=1 Tax=Aureobasidium uvarum TaxID=2773716 RepID=A0A9N8PU45_9PEZI|nr:unnamed protein product [Aureobasidium uvarum]